MGILLALTAADATGFESSFSEMPLSTYNLSHSTPGYFLSPLNERFQTNYEKER